MKVLTFEQIALAYPVGKSIKSAKSYVDLVMKTFDKNNIILDASNKNIRIWCRGSSGAILATLLASKFKKTMPTIFYVNKEAEHRHAGSCEYNNVDDPGIDIVIDDIMASGRTIYSIWHDSPIKKIDYLILSSVVCSFFKEAYNKQNNLALKRNEFTKTIPIPKVLICCENEIFFSEEELSNLKPTTKEI